MMKVGKLWRDVIFYSFMLIKDYSGGLVTFKWNVFSLSFVDKAALKLLPLASWVVIISSDTIWIQLSWADREFALSSLHQWPFPDPCYILTWWRVQIPWCHWRIVSIYRVWVQLTGSVGRGDGEDSQPNSCWCRSEAGFYTYWLTLWYANTARFTHTQHTLCFLFKKKVYFGQVWAITRLAYRN